VVIDAPLSRAPAIVPATDAAGPRSVPDMDPAVGSQESSPSTPPLPGPRETAPASVSTPSALAAPAVPVPDGNIPSGNEPTPPRAAARDVARDIAPSKTSASAAATSPAPGTMTAVIRAGDPAQLTTADSTAAGPAMLRMAQTPPPVTPA